jgi:hypothetical protein
MNILSGPKLGDFIHSLIVPKYLYDNGYRDINIVLGEVFDNFSLGFDRAFEDLKEIVESQEYTNKFKKLEESDQIDMNLCMFRGSPLLNKKPFWKVYLHTFLQNEPKVPKNYNWLTLPKVDGYSDTLIINRSHTRDTCTYTKHTHNEYEKVMKQYDRKLFICFDMEQYNNFAHKDKCEVYQPKDLHEFCTIINSGKRFLGNQSSPLAIATALNVPRTGELLYNATQLHYLNDYLYYDNCNFFVSNQ